jgi:hypothetical protein
VWRGDRRYVSAAGGSARLFERRLYTAGDERRDMEILKRSLDRSQLPLKQSPARLARP